MHYALPVAVLTMGLLMPSPARAFAPELGSETDADLITALDLSDSIMRHEEWIEFEGLARAVEHREFLRAVAGGRFGRVGFAVFAWSSGGVHQDVVPWTVIAGPADAARVADRIRHARKTLRFDLRMARRTEPHGAAPPGRTDLSAALEFAIGRALSRPHPADRTVINVCGNGDDNVGAPPDQARDLAVGFGLVVNAMVIGRRPGLAEYYRRHVQGGAGSFVLDATAPDALGDAFLEKLLRDLIAAPRTGLPAPIS